MKTITRMKPLALTAILLLSFAAMTIAQTTMYSTNWNSGFDGWTIESTFPGTVPWNNRGGGDGIEAPNTQDLQSEEWIISPEFDFSNGSTFTLKFISAQADNGSPAGKLDVYYSENWGSDGTGATWTSIDLDITSGYPVGWNGGAGYQSSAYVMPSTSATVRIAFKYTSDGWNDNGTPTVPEDDINKNRIRVKDLSITTSGAVSEWPLPYTAAWSADLEDWTIVDKKYTSKTWGWKSSGTAKATDSKKENDDWLISPTIICTGSEQKEISFKAGWNGAKSSNISLYYATDYTGDQSTATWQLLVANIIPTDHAYGFASAAQLSFSHIMDLDNASVNFAIHYAPFGPAEGSQNEIRVKTFKIEKVTPTAIDDNKIQSVKLFPNPATSTLNIDIDGEAVVEIYNLAGQMVKSLSVQSKQVNISELQAGQYIIMVKQNDEVLVNKFIKK